MSTHSGRWARTCVLGKGCETSANVDLILQRAGHVIGEVKIRRLNSSINLHSDTALFIVRIAFWPFATVVAWPVSNLFYKFFLEWMARVCGIHTVRLSATAPKLRRTDEGQKARNSCLRLLSSLSAGHVRFWPNRSAMLRRCLSRCLVSVDWSQRGAS